MKDSDIEKLAEPMRELGTAIVKNWGTMQKSFLRAQAEIHKGWLDMIEKTLKEVEHQETKAATAVQAPKSEKVKIA